MCEGDTTSMSKTELNVICDSCAEFFGDESGITNYADLVEAAHIAGESAGDHNCDRILVGPEVVCSCPGHFDFSQVEFAPKPVISCACCGAPEPMGEVGFKCACIYGYCVDLGNVCIEWQYASEHADSIPLHIRIMQSLYDDGRYEGSPVTVEYLSETDLFVVTVNGTVIAEFRALYEARDLANKIRPVVIKYDDTKTESVKRRLTRYC